MKFTINTALQRDAIRDLLNGKTFDGITYTFEAIKGLDIIFHADSDDEAKVLAIAKRQVKSTPYGGTILFSLKRIG